eukprot:scaffold8005_cov118-Isochrysis_galbana.AAC.7
MSPAMSSCICMRKVIDWAATTRHSSNEDHPYLRVRTAYCTPTPRRAARGRPTHAHIATAHSA